MGKETAQAYIKKHLLENNIINLDTSTATVLDAANSLKCQASQIGKTLSFYIENEYFLIVMAGDAKIDNQKYRKEFNTKAHMIKYEDVEPIIGHAPGGVCPFGINDGIKVYLDFSLKKHDYFYLACGDGMTVVKCTVNELERIIPVEKWVDVTK